jgi:acyl dehydratase
MTDVPIRQPGTRFVVEKPAVTRVQLAMYAGASDDYNPIHYDEDYAKKAGLGGVIAHGMLTMGFMAQALTNWAGPRSRVRRIRARFTSPVRPGDVVRVEGEVISNTTGGDQCIVDCKLTARVGERAVAVCEATVFVPVYEDPQS